MRPKKLANKLEKMIYLYSQAKIEACQHIA